MRIILKLLRLWCFDHFFFWAEISLLLKLLHVTLKWKNDFHSFGAEISLLLNLQNVTLKWKDDSHLVNAIGKIKKWVLKWTFFLFIPLKWCFSNLVIEVDVQIRLKWNYGGMLSLDSLILRAFSYKFKPSWVEK